MDKEKLEPFNVYLMKLLYCKLDILKTHLPFLIKRAPWVSMIEIKDTEAAEKKRFAYLSDQQFVQFKAVVQMDKIDKFL